MNLLYILKRSLLLLFVIVSLNLNAQTVVATKTEDSGVEMADSLRKDGKIYVVVTVIATIMAGIVVYLIRLDSKITQLEKEVGTRNSVSK